jgi:hypothetical protein
VLIASKLPPLRTDRTYFSSGRAAFAYLIGELVRPRVVYLPAFTCWSLVSTMQRRFAGVELRFYPVRRDLACSYPAYLDQGEALVFIHFFGYENQEPLPAGPGVLIEDVSHAYLSNVPPRGAFIFGSLRKIVKVGDGGFLDGFHNPVYEPDRKLDTWLRYEAEDWTDMREAENMLDRSWSICDMSSQSLAIVLGIDRDQVRRRRQENERFLRDNLAAGRPIRPYRANECPLLHQRLFDDTEERDALRAHLAAEGIFTSIHWPTHPLVRQNENAREDPLWLESHSLAIPVASEYGLDDMERIAESVFRWTRQDD